MFTSPHNSFRNRGASRLLALGLVLTTGCQEPTEMLQATGELAASSQKEPAAVALPTNFGEATGDTTPIVEHKPTTTEPAVEASNYAPAIS